jgi:hypothetical protein
MTSAYYAIFPTLTHLGALNLGRIQILQGSLARLSESPVQTLPAIMRKNLYITQTQPSSAWAHPRQTNNAVLNWLYPIEAQ